MRLANRLLGGLSVVLVTLVTLATAHAQAIQLTEREFYLAVARFQTVTDRVPHRETQKTTEFSEGRTILTTSTTREWDGSGNYRVISKRPNNGTSSVTESIWIGSIEYSRKDAGNWSKIDWSRGGTGRDGLGPDDEAKYYFEERKDGPGVAKIYTSEITYNRTSEKRIEITKYFTNELNWRLRIEKRESLNTPLNVVSSSITIFDYNPGKIEIKAPIK